MVTQPAASTDRKGVDSPGPIHHTKALYASGKTHTIWLAPPWELLLLSFSFTTPTCQGAFLCLLQSPYLVVTLSPMQIISAHLP